MNINELQFPILDSNKSNAIIISGTFIINENFTKSTQFLFKDIRHFDYNTQQYKTVNDLYELNIPNQIKIQKYIVRDIQDFEMFKVRLFDEIKYQIVDETLRSYLKQNNLKIRIDDYYIRLQSQKLLVDNFNAIIVENFEFKFGYVEKFTMYQNCKYCGHHLDELPSDDNGDDEVSNYRCSFCDTHFDGYELD